jgi:hypothetical protein
MRSEMSHEEKDTYPIGGLGWPVTIVSTEGDLEAAIESVSSKGALISCNDIPPLTKSLQLIIRPPNYKTVFTSGKIIWSTILKSDEGDSRLGIAIQFITLTASDRQFLSSAAAKLGAKNINRATDKE